MTYWHPLRAPSGEIVAVNVAAEEITERKRAEQAVRSARDAAETALRHLRETQDSLIEAEKLAALGRMVAGVAHEVNTPLGISLTVASTLQHKAAQFAAETARGNLRRSSFNEFVATIRDASEQLVTNLGRAAEHVQSFKRLALEREQPHRRSFDAGELAEQVLSHLGAELRERGLTLGFRAEGDLTMDGYPGSFGQVLTHIATNAMTHAFVDRHEGTIDVRLNEVDAGHIALVVTDNGRGMPPEIKRQAFDPFFTTRRHQGAAGLGLHTVHTIVTERLGGQLRLDSELHAGTRVHVILPRMAPQ
jgi:signal transduction histidine kinase